MGIYLGEQGKILKAAGRCGHRDPATTLRNYAHVQPSTTKTSPTSSTPSTASHIQASQPRTAKPHKNQLTDRTCQVAGIPGRSEREIRAP